MDFTTNWTNLRDLLLLAGNQNEAKDGSIHNLKLDVRILLTFLRRHFILSG